MLSTPSMMWQVDRNLTFLIVGYRLRCWNWSERGTNSHPTPWRQPDLSFQPSTRISLISELLPEEIPLPVSLHSPFKFQDLALCALPVSCIWDLSVWLFFSYLLTWVFFFLVSHFFLLFSLICACFGTLAYCPKKVCYEKRNVVK